MKYFEITFGQYGSSTESYLPSICIKGLREPSRVEAQEFCETDMDMMGADFVKDVRRITSTEAHDEFDMSNEEDWPVFADEEDWD